MAQLHFLSPLGFRAAGVVAGIKTAKRPDIGLLICDDVAAAAAVFTTNKVCAAPVQIGRNHIARGTLRGVVVNSGNANACTGKQGEKDAIRMCALAARIAGCDPHQILPSSTGVIGHHLPMEKVERGIVEAGKYLGNSLEHALLFADAIMTTDLKRKMAAEQFTVGRQKAIIAGVAKGSGMIGPRVALGTKHATMLAYITTDVQVSPATLRRAMQEAADASFNAVTVDDQTSTNDTAAVLASGASGIKIDSAAATKSFAKALREVCEALAYEIAADGEGATKVITVIVDKAPTVAVARAIARSIANSPLVKCAMHGNDPNWGRILCAAGLVGVPFDAEKCLLTLQGIPVFRKGQPVAFEAQLVSQSLHAPEVRIHLTCNTGSAAAKCWGCDLSKEYVTINADYRT